MISFWTFFFLFRIVLAFIFPAIFIELRSDWKEDCEILVLDVQYYEHFYMKLEAIKTSLRFPIGVKFHFDVR